MKYFWTLAAAGFVALAVPATAQDVPLPETPAAWSAPDRELMVPVEGGRVWVRVNGDLEADAPPAIFIHGGPGGTHTVFGELLSLSDERAVILYDQLDSGMSDRPEDPANWRVERFVAELEAIRQALGVERWHVIGHSWGAALALEYAAAYPEHTASAVLASPWISTPHWIMDTNLLIRELPDPTRDALIACEAGNAAPIIDCDAATAAFYAEYNGRADTPPRSPQVNAYRQRYRGEGFNDTIYNAMWGPSEFSARGTLLEYDATPLLMRIGSSRLLYILGQYDEVRIDTVQDYARLTPGAEIAVVPGGSHGFPIERPRESNALLGGWMSRVDARVNAE